MGFTGMGKYGLLVEGKCCLPKIAYQVTRTRVLTVLIRLIQSEKIHTTIVE